MGNLAENLSKSTSKCIKNDEKLKKKMTKNRKLQQVSSSKPKKSSKKSILKPKNKTSTAVKIPKSSDEVKRASIERNCSSSARKFRLTSINVKKSQEKYEKSVKQCGKVISELKSKLICASCDPTINSAIQGTKKLVEISE